MNNRLPAGEQIGMTWYTTYTREMPPGGLTSGSSYPAEGPFWSWMMRIAPYIEQGAFQSKANMTGTPSGWPWWQYFPGTSTSIVGTTVSTFSCPSDPRGSSGLVWVDPANANNKAALSDYLGVVGRNTWAAKDCPSAPGQNGMIYVNSGVRLTGVTDGTSNTVMVGERPPSADLQYGWQWAGSGYDDAAFGAGDSVLGVRERLTNPGAAPDYYRPGNLASTNSFNDNDRHFWSLHPGGGMWLFGDGSVRFITYSSGTAIAGTFNGISGVTVLECLASRADGEVFTLN